MYPINDKHSSGRTALDLSCGKGHANVCQLLLEMKADIESLDDDGYTPFLTASYFGHVNVLKLLIEWQCDTAARNKNNNGALALAASNGQVDAIQFLVNVVHLPINDKHSSGRTALDLSCGKGHANVCQLLLEMKADIESLDDDGYTPFLTASYFGHVNVLKLLIQWQCDTSARNKVGYVC
jgi:ankyrin repeat protein